MRSIFIFFNSLIFILLFYSNNALSNTLERIDIIGNERISDETIKLFINVKVNDEIDNEQQMLRMLYCNILQLQDWVSVYNVMF